jgi:hypothetical protein
VSFAVRSSRGDLMDVTQVAICVLSALVIVIIVWLDRHPSND